MTKLAHASQKHVKVDRFGAVASSLCALHCATCALLPAAFGAMGLEMLLNHEAEWVFTLTALAFATLALILSWRKHRSFLVAGMLTVGIVGLLTSRVLEMGSDHHDHHGDGHHAETHTDGDHKGALISTENHHAVHHSEAKHAEKAHAETHDTESALLSEKHHDAQHTDEHASNEMGHSDAIHAIGALIGVMGGLFLVMGHLLNIRTGRQLQLREACCD